MILSFLLQPEEKQRASQQFIKLHAAMKVLGISGEEQKALWLILGAIYHLGAAGATKGKDSHDCMNDWKNIRPYIAVHYICGR